MNQLIFYRTVVALVALLATGLICGGVKAIDDQDLRRPADLSSFGIVALTENGSLEFRGTILISQDGRETKSCGNLVLFDQRGGMDVGHNPGMKRIVELTSKNPRDAWVRLEFLALPGTADGIITIEIDADKASGSWQLESMSGISGKGRCILWSQPLSDDLTDLTMDQHIDRWSVAE